MADVDDDEDGLQSGFFYFVEALRRLAGTAEEQPYLLSNGLVPWDIQDDALHGLHLRDHPDLGFSTQMKDQMGDLARNLQQLPDAALWPSERPFTKANCLAVLQHSAWAPLRLQAAHLLQELEPVIQRNREALNLD